MILRPRCRRRAGSLSAFHSLWVGKADDELLRSSPPLADAEVSAWPEVVAGSLEDVVWASRKLKAATPNKTTAITSTMIQPELSPAPDCLPTYRSARGAAFHNAPTAFDPMAVRITQSRAWPEKLCVGADDRIYASAFGGLHPGLADSRMSCRLARGFSRDPQCVAKRSNPNKERRDSWPCAFLSPHEAFRAN
jgi:hypothetical protein